MLEKWWNKWKEKQELKIEKYYNKVDSEGRVEHKNLIEWFESICKEQGFEKVTYEGFAWEMSKTLLIFKFRMYPDWTKRPRFGESIRFSLSISEMFYENPEFDHILYLEEHKDKIIEELNKYEEDK